MPYYQYFKRENITPFIDLNGKGGRSSVYKNDFTIDKDGVSLCPSGCRMRRDGVEAVKGRMKFKSNTDALFIWLLKIIQDYSTILQGAVRNGSWNTMQGLLLNALTNVRN